MKTAAHQYEDKLLEFAYGELPSHEADAVDAHVRGCVRCAQSLAEIRAVRTTMGQLPLEAAPDAGLESLLAYADQQAARNAAAQPQPWWKKLLTPRRVASLGSVAALCTIGIVAWRASQDFNPDAGQLAVQQMARRDQAEAVAPAPVTPPPLTKAAPQAEPPYEKKGLLDAPADVAKAEGGLAGGKRAGEDQGGRELAKDAKVKVANDKQLAQADDFDSAFGTKESSAKRQAPKPAMKEPLPMKELATNYSDASRKGAPTRAPEPDAELDRKRAEDPASVATVAEQPVSQQGYGLGTGATGGAVAQGKAEAKPKPSAPADKRGAKNDDGKAGEERSPVVAAAPTPSAQPSQPPPPATKSAPSLSMRSLGGTSNQPSDELSQGDVSDQLAANQEQAFKARQTESARLATVQSARAAAQRGDRESELKYAAEAVRLGVTGGARLDMLQRLCDGFEALGQASQADPYCDALLTEYPRSSAATAVAQRRSYQQRPAAASTSTEAPTKPADAKPAPSKKAKKAVDTSAY